MYGQRPFGGDPFLEDEAVQLLDEKQDESIDNVNRCYRSIGSLLSSWLGTVKYHYRLPPPRRRWFSRFGSLLSIICAFFAIISITNGLLWPSYSNPPAHYSALRTRILYTAQHGRGNVRNEKVFIAANILDEDLIRGHWGEALHKTIELLGEDNVFVSIFENDSGNGTRQALKDLRNQLQCNSSIVTGAHLPLTHFDRVTLPNGERKVLRIEYLAEVRNQLLRPLDSKHPSNPATGFRSAAHISFDKILFLNDVFFDPIEALQLLFSTNVEDGVAKYRAACALDFIRGAQMYDTFVLRDSNGFGSGFMLYPWFAPVGDQASRSAVLRQSDAVPVRSCWGGMAAFDATYFQSRDAAVAWSEMADYELLHFRSSGEVFWEAAECCLVFADIEAQYGQAVPEEGTGVFVNPYIRTAYSASTWQWLPTFRRFERSFQFLQYAFSKLVYPGKNERRLHEAGDMVNETVWRTDMDQEGEFVTLQRQARPGGFCGQRKLFVMKDDLIHANTDGTGKNWYKVPVPDLELRT